MCKLRAVVVTVTSGSRQGVVRSFCCESFAGLHLWMSHERLRGGHNIIGSCGVLIILV